MPLLYLAISVCHYSFVLASMVHRPRLELGCSKERQVYSLLAVHPAMRCKMEEGGGIEPL